MGISIKDQSIFSVDMVNEVFGDLFKNLERHNPTTYDKIMDAVYRETHIGGGTHRHFDGTHTFAGSYDAIKNVTGDVDALKYIKAHANELVTPEGIPLLTLDKLSFDRITAEISEILGDDVTTGQIRALVRDFNSFNAGEVVSAAVGVAFMAYALKSGDSQSISRTVAVNLCLGIYTANPLQIFSALAGLSIGVYRGHIKSWDLLKGAVPVAFGVAGYEVGQHVLDLGNNGSLMLAVSMNIGSAIAVDYLDAKRRALVNNELGSSKYYLPVMTPSLISKDLEIIGRRLPTLLVLI